MKILLKILVFMFVTCSFARCYYPYPPSPSLDEFAYSYEHAIVSFPDSLVDIFPDIYEGNLYHYSTNDQKNDSMRILRLVVSYPKKYVRNLKKEIALNAKAIYSFGDECFRMLQYSDERYEGRIKLLQCSENTNKLPISNFSYISAPAIPDSFFRKAKIYVLDAQELGEDDYGLKPNSIDKTWKHGYTKGIAIHGHIVAYWLEIW